MIIYQTTLNITEGNNSYIQFKTKNNEEQIIINKNINIPDNTPIFLAPVQLEL